MLRFLMTIVLVVALAPAELCRWAAESRRVRRRRLAAYRQPDGLRPDQGGDGPAQLPGDRPDRRGRADRALRRGLDRDRQRRAGRVPQGAGRGGRHDPQRVASIRCTSTTPRTAISRRIGCSPHTGSTARSSMRRSPAA